MEESKVKNLIKVWYLDKARVERDEFFKFLCFWICFNAWLCYISNKGRDKEMIEWLIDPLNNCDLRISFFEIKQKNHLFVEDLKILVKMCPIKDSRGTGDINIKDPDDFENIVKAIYKTRCNLFHGGRSASESREKKLVMISNKILERWVGNLTAKW